MLPQILEKQTTHLFYATIFIRRFFMRKRILLLICSFVLVFSLTSCGVKDVLELDKNLHNIVEVVSGEAGLEGIYYQDKMYYIDRWNLFTVTINSYDIYEGDVLVSWNGPRFGYKAVFYSYTKDAPLFIYEMAFDDVFFHETYDYTQDTFVIDGTDAEIVFSDIVSDLSVNTDWLFREDACVQLHSKKHPRIRMELDLKCSGDQWYIRTSTLRERRSRPSTAWAVSDAFVQLLTQNGII